MSAGTRDDVHVAATWVSVGADAALSRLADPLFVGRWALGAMGLRPSDEPQIGVGHSLFDGARILVRIVANAELRLIDYHVGRRKPLQPRIFIRVVDGRALGGDAGSCLVVMAAMRAADATDEGWIRTCKSHEVEILLIKARLECPD